MLTTIDLSIEFLVEWLHGPGSKRYQQWTDRIERCFRAHRQDRRYTFTGTARQDDRARKRVSALLIGLKELADKNTDWKRFKAVGEELNCSLARYHYSPQLGLDRLKAWKPKMEVRDDRPHYIVPVAPALARDGVFFWASLPDASEIPRQELNAVRGLESIVRNDWLDLIRRCAQCSRWFIARMPWAKHCDSPVCRVAAKRAYQTSEGYKQRRRKILPKRNAP